VSRPKARARARPLRPLALDAVRTYPLSSRRSKVQQADFARLHKRGASFASFLAGLPRILAGATLRRLCDAIASARARGRPVVWGLGAHVIKVGLSPVLIDLMERGEIPSAPIFLDSPLAIRATEVFRKNAESLDPAVDHPPLELVVSGKSP